MLAINCFAKADGALVFEPYRMIERGGLRVAVIGIACPIVDKTMPPAFSEGVRFTIGNDELPRWIETVRRDERADLVVVLSHLGFPQDVKLARETDGIDVLVSGHTHNRMRDAIVENGAIVFQSGCHGSFIGRLDVEVADRRVVSHRHQLIPVDDTLDEEPADARARRRGARPPPIACSGEVVGSVSLAAAPLRDAERAHGRRAARGDRRGGGDRYRVFQRLALRRAGCAGRRHDERSLEHHPDQSAGVGRRA